MCILLFVTENKEPPSENMKGGIVGGVLAAVVAIAIIGTIVTVYIVKRRKGLVVYTLVLFHYYISYQHV